METTRDLFRRFNNEKLPRRSPPQILRGKVWLSFILHTHNMTLKDFSARYVENETGGTSSLVYKWRSGEAVPSRKTVERISRRIPGTHRIYNLPLWDLLEDKPIPKTKIDKLIAPYWDPTIFPGIGCWTFSFDCCLKRPNSPELDPLGKFNSSALLQRGDIYGFTAIVAAARTAEAIGNGDTHWVVCSDMYRALPAILKDPWFYEHFELLTDCIEHIHNRIWTSWVLFSVNWDIIHRQIKDPTFETLREMRPRDPKTLRYIDLEDPIHINIKRKFFKKSKQQKALL